MADHDLITKATKNVLLIRHALPHEGHQFHPGDPQLHPGGIKHANRLARRLQREGVDQIFSSPQRRAIETVQPFTRLPSVSPTILEGLAEVNYGTDWYRFAETIQTKFLDRFAEFAAYPAAFWQGPE